MSNKLDQESWLVAGLQVLAEEGPEGLRIMATAQKLGVTKGSFYWHFRSLEDFHIALLGEWEQRHTQQIIRHVENKGGEALVRLRNLMTLTFGADVRLEQAIRRWASTHPQAREAQARVDRDRLAYLASLLRPLGWPPSRADFLARWIYSALIGHFSLESPAISKAQISLILDILTPEPRAAAALA